MSQPSSNSAHPSLPPKPPVSLPARPQVPSASRPGNGPNNQPHTGRNAYSSFGSNSSFSNTNTLFKPRSVATHSNSQPHWKPPPSIIPPGAAAAAAAAVSGYGHHGPPSSHPPPFGQQMNHQPQPSPAFYPQHQHSQQPQPQHHMPQHFQQYQHHPQAQGHVDPSQVGYSHLGYGHPQAYGQVPGPQAQPQAASAADYDAQVAQWQSAYYGGGAGVAGAEPDARIAGVYPGVPHPGMPTDAPSGQAPQGDHGAAGQARPDDDKYVVRSGGGKTWVDPKLLEWDPSHFRLFVGNIAGDVSDDALYKAFAKYTSITKARVVRMKQTNKSRGYGFVSFSDSDDYFRAFKEMQGKYIGSHPVKIDKANSNITPVMKKPGGGNGGGGGGKHRGGNGGNFHNRQDRQNQQHQASHSQPGTFQQQSSSHVQSQSGTPNNGGFGSQGAFKPAASNPGSGNGQQNGPRRPRDNNNGNNNNNNSNALGLRKNAGVNKKRDKGKGKTRDGLKLLG